MKKLNLLFVLVIIIFTGSLLNAQNTRDVVRLKSGSIFKGQIIEQIADSTIKLKTSNGSYIFYMKDVRNISKETYTPGEEDVQWKGAIIPEVKKETKEPVTAEPAKSFFTGLNMMVFGALAMPEGDFASPGFGKATLGAIMGADGIVRTGSLVSLNFGLSYSVNAHEGTNLYMPESYTVFWPMAGIRIEPVEEQIVSFYLSVMAGLAICDGPTKSVSRFAWEEAGMGNTTVFAYSAGFGTIINHRITFSIRGYFCSPEHNGFKLPVNIAALMIGYQI